MITSQVRDRLIFYQKLIRSRRKVRPTKDVIERMAIDFVLSTPAADNMIDLHILAYPKEGDLVPTAVRRIAASRYWNMYYKLSREAAIQHRAELFEIARTPYRGAI
jgi:hypothetical protein